MLDFLKRGIKYYREHPWDKWALILSIIALIVACTK